jgi:hypothetical protein
MLQRKGNEMETEKTTIEPLADQEKISEDSCHHLKLAESYEKITTKETYAVVVGFQKQAKLFIKETEESCKPRVKQASDLHKSLLADMNALTAPAKKSISTYNALLVEYNNELERKRKAEQAERERERIKQEAIDRKAEDERKLKVANELHESGSKEEAEQVLNQADRTQVAPVEKKEEKAEPEGLHFRDNWKAEMVAVDIDEVDSRFVKKEFDQGMANAYAKSNKDGAKAKGIRFYNDKTPVTRL